MNKIGYHFLLTLIFLTAAANVKAERSHQASPQTPVPLPTVKPNPYLEGQIALHTKRSIRGRRMYKAGLTTTLIGGGTALMGLTIALASKPAAQQNSDPEACVNGSVGPACDSTNSGQMVGAVIMSVGFATVIAGSFPLIIGKIAERRNNRKREYLELLNPVVFDGLSAGVGPNKGFGLQASFRF